MKVVVELQSLATAAGPAADAGTIWTMRVRQPIRPDNPMQLFPAGAELAALRNLPLVEPMGRALLDQLTGHPVVATLLPPLCADPPAEGSVYVQLSNTGIEDIPWEALRCADQIGELDTRFLSLTPHWPVGRLVPAGRDRPSRLRVPVRVVAVISALGVDYNIGEWTALRAALTSNGAAPTELLVLTGDPAVYTAVAADIDAGLFPGSQVDYIPAKIEMLADAIGDWEPDILHFYCHGSSADNGTLHIGTKSDFQDLADGEDSDPLSSGIVLQAGGILRCVPPQAGWLLTLNCCEGGAAGADLSSLAYRVTQTGRFAAVVAHRKAVPVTDANLMCRALYRAVLAAVGAALEQPPQLWPWPGLLHSARRYLVDSTGMTFDEAARRSDRWLTPVVYVAEPQEQLQVSLRSGRPLTARMAQLLARDDPDGRELLDHLTRDRL